MIERQLFSRISRPVLQASDTAGAGGISEETGMTRILFSWESVDIFASFFIFKSKQNGIVFPFSNHKYPGVPGIGPSVFISKYRKIGFTLSQNIKNCLGIMPDEREQY